MAAQINVRRDVDDAFYRYKMEPLKTKIEGKGNGIKTVVVNLSSVAQAVYRPGAYVIKYFGFELGAQTNVDPADDRWIINGAHESSKLQDLLDGFINKFVLCGDCSNPETEVIIEDGLIDLDCKACGSRTKVDSHHKLGGYITKSAPKKGKKDKATRKAERKARKEVDEEGSDNGSGEDHVGSPNGEANGHNGDAAAASDDENTSPVAEEAPEFATNGDDAKPQWTVDMSAEAVKARQASLPAEFQQKLSLGGDDEDEEGGGGSVYDDFGVWIQEQAETKGGIDKVDSIDIYLKAKELGIEGKHRTVLVLVQTLFDKNICAQIPKRAAMLKQFGDSERHQRALLGGTERFIVFGSDNKEDPELLSQIVKILQHYYTCDLLTEEVAEKWGTKASKKYVDLRMSKKIRKAAEPFLTWLAEAEEESEDEESEEEDDEE
jgi:translation initiation factor 5